MNKQNLQTIISKLDTNAITLTEAKAYAHLFGFKSEARTKKAFIKALCAAWA